MKILLCAMFWLFLFAYLNSNRGYARLGFHLMYVSWLHEIRVKQQFQKL